MQFRVKSSTAVEDRQTRAPGAGRPKGDPDKALTEQVYVSLTRAEKAHYRRQARRQKRTLSFLLREELGLSTEREIKPAGTRVES